MKTDNDGGPAFPSHGSMGEVAHRGMSLRDYFAARVLEGFCAAPEFNWAKDIDLARRCYAIADAMIQERKQ